MRSLFYFLERTSSKAGYNIPRWQICLIISFIFLIGMFCSNNYTLKCDGQNCSVIKHKYLAALFKKDINKFEQLDVNNYTFSCSQQADHYSSRKIKNTHDECELILLLNDGRRINTYQIECYGKSELTRLAQKIMDGEVVERKN